MKKKFEPAPYMIIGAFASFAAFILYMVFMAFQSDLNMVRKDYYEQELKYSEQQRQISHADALGNTLQLNFESKNKQITLMLPTDFAEDKVKGSFWFYRPSDSKLDFEVPLETRNLNEAFNVGHLQKGKWIAKVSFEYMGKSYFKEQAFIID